MNLVLTNLGWRSDSSFPEKFNNTDLSVYEVIRIIDGVALFLEDHFDRLKRSIQIQGLTFQMDFQDFKQNIVELIKQNHRPEGNIRFAYFVSDGNIGWEFGFIAHTYPSIIDYKEGILTDLLLAERPNPNAKVIHSEIRERANQLITNRILYEVLLVDRDGMITEGSRSNVFFVKSDVFYTAPASMVLEGITRQKVLDCLKLQDFKVVGQAVSKDQIDDFDAVFLTGTSPKVLPIRNVGELMFDVENKAVLKLMDSYNLMIEDYIRNENNISKW